MYFICSILAVFLVLVVSEAGWRKHWLKGEIGRKFVHVIVGSFVAFWPFFLSWNEIRILSLAFFVVVLISKQLHIFRAVHSVQRPTYGEALFAISVGLLTFITHSKGIYAAAILQMSLADGFAAIAGTRYGTSNKYHVLGQPKSVAGTATFAVISFALLVGYATFSVAGLSTPALFIGAIGATALENFGLRGIDNLLVPVFIGLILANL